MAKFVERLARVFERQLDDGTTVCSCLVGSWREGWFLYRLQTKEPYRKQGHATALLRDVAASVRGPVYLATEPFGEGETMDELQLQSWYRRHGWVLVGSRDGQQLMKRECLQVLKIRGTVS